ncbi:MAG: 1-(5-phosphoribosyl)-5-amino-4-imidazole-carboxylate carboxylase, partial [Veillonella caviae]|nr:1-(5-phosphoribosyl)-5-amino-4-imidazole-carboxylate carboxylase [Veillonella caviae]
MQAIRQLLESVQKGTIDVDTALLTLKQQPFEDLGYAHVDLHRTVRQGVPEVIYGEGKTAEQIHGIVQSMMDNHMERLLITRLDVDKANVLQETLPITYHEVAHLGVVGTMPKQRTSSYIAIVTGGTSDM